MLESPKLDAEKGAGIVPAVLHHLIKLIHGKSYEAAKRAMVAQVGSIKPREKFDDDLADAIFLRLQQVAQVGRYTTQSELAYRNAIRLVGEGDVTLYRCAPPGAGIRPGDFAASSPHEAGFYKHGVNKIQAMSVRREDVVSVDGSMGGGKEYVLLPKGHVFPSPVEHFKSFRAFFEAIQHPLDPSPRQEVKAAHEALAWLDSIGSKPKAKVKPRA